MFFPYKRPNGKNVFFRPCEYIYDEYYDCVICPENQILLYRITNRDGYKEVLSNKHNRANCHSRAKCTENKDGLKTVVKHIGAQYLEMAEDMVILLNSKNCMRNEKKP